MCHVGIDIDIFRTWNIQVNLIYTRKSKHILSSVKCVIPLFGYTLQLLSQYYIQFL